MSSKREFTIKELATAAAAAAAAKIDDDDNSNDDEKTTSESIVGNVKKQTSTILKKTLLRTSVSEGSSSHSHPSCQAENCDADLTEEKKYHRRHKVCEAHSKAAVVMLAGIQQRFCQQCSRFHELSEFDDTKRSCRTRLAGHNERRRKITSDAQGEGSNHCPQADEDTRIQINHSENSPLNNFHFR